MTTPQIMFDPAKLKLIDPKTLKKDPKNRNKHSKEQIERFCELLKIYGMRWPILVSERTGIIKAGEGRLLAALKLGMPQVLVSYQEFDSDEIEYGFGISDNAIALWAELDLSGIHTDLKSFNSDFDINLLGIKSFELDLSEKEMEEIPSNDEVGLTKIIIHLKDEQYAEVMPRIQSCCEKAELFDLTSFFLASLEALEEKLEIELHA